MASKDFDESELAATSTAGYKGPGKETTEEERKRLDFYDDSLAKYEASLGIGQASTGTGPKVTVLNVTLKPTNRPGGPIVIDLTSNAQSKPVVLKEGSTFVPQLTFKVNHGIIAGLRYIQVAKRMGLSQKTEEMVGSYAASPEPYTKSFPEEDAPSGMMMRGDYKVRTRVIDDDGNTYLSTDWRMTIAKDW